MNIPAIVVCRRLARYGANDHMWFEETIPAAIRAEMAMGMSVMEQDTWLCSHSGAAAFVAIATGKRPPTNISPEAMALVRAANGRAI